MCLMQGGSASTDLRPCLKAITEEHVDTRYCSMVSDDIDALHISRKGHLDNKVRIAVEEGVDPVTAIQWVTITRRRTSTFRTSWAALPPGKIRRHVFLSSLEKCSVEKVIANGELVVDDRKLTKELPRPNYSIFCGVP